MTSLFNDNENIACESCGKVIVREMSFNSIKLFTVTINGKHWTRAKEICKSLKYEKKTGNVIRDHVSNENTRYKCDFISVPETGTPVLWPADSQKYDLYINEQGMYELVCKSEQNLAKDFQDYCFNVMFPQIRNHFEQLAINVKDREHQLAIEDIGREQQQRIEQNESTIAILNDDLDESQREYAILEYKYEQLEYRAVPYLEDPKKDNGIVVIQKNNGDEYPYIAICGQQGYVAQKIKNKLIDFPNGQIVVLAETGNAIVHYNFLRERGCIEVNPDRVRHFRLGTMTHQQLLYLEEA